MQSTPQATMVTYKFYMAVMEKILAIFSNRKRSNSAGLALTCSAGIDRVYKK